MSLLQSIADGFFTIVCEFTPHSKQEVEHIAQLAQGLVDLNRKYEKDQVRFAGIALTQNPGGNLSYDHMASLAILDESGFPQELEVVPHITGKDMNIDGIQSLLLSLSERGVTTALALTGDAPVSAQGVFELDSLGLLQLIESVNVQRLRACKSVNPFSDLPILRGGAAVSPFKYTRGSLAMQMIKASKKVREGAAFLTCQSGWDANRSEQLPKFLSDVKVPLIGNVLVINEIAGKFMKQLPGCVITDEFLERMHGESIDDALARASQQMAMFRQLGYAGVDLGKPGEFESIEQIAAVVDGALAIEDWRAHKDNLTFAPPDSPAPTLQRSAPVSTFVHNTVFEPDGALHNVAKSVLGPFNRSSEREGALYQLFKALEAGTKEAMYECQHCGDCHLPENKYICSLGGCEKGFPNPPCGDADPQGRCGSNENRVCVGERLYYRMLPNDALEEFKQITMPRRDPKLRGSASVLNYFFGRDHTAHRNPLEGSGLIQVAELLHASIPFPGAAMRYLQRLGDEGYERPNRGLAAIKYIIESQALQGADYIDVNIDELADPDAPSLIRRYVSMIYQFGHGIPLCVDSSDKNVLLSGLDQWFQYRDARKPLMNSIPYNEMENMDDIFEARRKHPFSVVCLLVGSEGPMKTKEEMVEAAREMFDRARQAGFSADELFFDTVTLGIATDSCIDDMGMPKPSHTHNSFHAIKEITTDPRMRGVHALLGVSNWVYGATKRRIGHIRAFIAVAQEYGLDAAIVDVAKQFGVRPAAPELVEFVRGYTALSGGDESMMDYSMMMAGAREKEWI